MPNIRRIPRWVVENDPTWERKIQSDPALLIWNKKGTNIKAISYPTHISCDVIGGDEIESEAGLPDLLSNFMMCTREDLLIGGDITKYLSSIYLNSGINNLSGPYSIGFSNKWLHRKPSF